MLGRPSGRPFPCRGSIVKTMADTGNGFVGVPEAVAELQAGRMIVVVDDEDRENEGDLTLAAEFCTPEAINFMARFGRGLICLTLTEERADGLRLGPMTQDNTSRFGTAFTESIEAREGVTTGISAADRAHTIRLLADPGKEVIASYGSLAPNGTYAARNTFLIDPNGVIRKVYTKVNPNPHSQDVLTDLAELQK